MLDSTQLVSGVAILLSFLAGYRYGLRNLDADTKEEAGASGGECKEAEKPRVIQPHPLLIFVPKFNAYI